MEETLEKVNKKLADLPEDKEVVGEVVVSVEIVVKSEIIVKPEVTEVCEPNPNHPANMPNAAVPFDAATGEDDDDVYKNIATLKLPFNIDDPKYWFTNFERY